MKKGFTLIELLGTIVILAILALITIPIISNVITNVRINALRDSAYGLVEASNLYYVSKGNNTTVRFDKNAEKDTLKELSYKGVVKIGTVIIDKKGQVTVCITDGKNSAYKNYNESKVTTSKGKICNIRDNSSIVYLDDEATITEISNTELIDRLEKLEEKMNNIYAVGSIYMSMTDDTVEKVQAKFGGTWEKIEDRFLLASGSEYEINKTGGSADSVVVSHSHIFSGTQVTTGVESNDHTHTRGTMDIEGTFMIRNGLDNVVVALWLNGAFSITDGNGDKATLAWNDNSTYKTRNVNFKASNNWTGSTSGASATHTHAVTADGTISTVGETGVGKNMPPYITVYMYKRTA